MEPDFDEEAFFAAIARSGARALLIGRRALVLLGLPVLTADYDFWLHIDDIERFNAALQPLGFAATHDPAAARGRGRYVLEDGEHVDVMVARKLATRDGQSLSFDDAWSQRQEVAFGDHQVAAPTLDHLILTKRIGNRPKDLEDERQLQALKERS